jgi:hypothetical protein
MNSLILRSNLFVQWITNPTYISPCCKLGLVGEEFDQMPENHIYLKIKRLK